MKLRSLGCLLLSVALLAMFGCGGGDGAANPSRATVKLATQGTLPPGTLIGGVQTMLNYSTNVGLSIAANDVVPSGAGAGSAVAANTNLAGQVTIGLLSATGIQTGEFATATFGIAAGNFPTSADFGIPPGFTVVDVNSVPIPGISVVVGPVTIQ